MTGGYKAIEDVCEGAKMVPGLDLTPSYITLIRILSDEEEVEKNRKSLN